MKLSNKLYDVLKYVAMVVLPALGTLYFALAQIWNLPYGTEIEGTILAIDTFLAALLQISTAKFKKENDEYCGIPFKDEEKKEGE